MKAGIGLLASMALLVHGGVAAGGEPLRRWAFALDAHHQEFRVPLELPPAADPKTLSLVIAVTRIERPAGRFFALRAQAICAAGEVAWSATVALYPLDQPSRFSRPLLRPGQSLDACAPTLVLQLQTTPAAGDVGAELPSLSGEIVIERAAP